MKEDAILKINKMGKIGHIMAMIVKVILIIATVGIVIGAVAVAVLPNNLVSFSVSGVANVKVNLDEFDVDFTDEQKSDIRSEIMGANEDKDASLDIQGISYGIDNVNVEDSYIEIDASAKTFEYTFKDLLILLLAVLMIVIMTLITVCFIDALCKAFRDCASPFEENVINKMQRLAYSLIPWGVLYTTAESIIKSMFTATVSVSISIDLGMIIVILVILAIAYVFKYGAILQQESDETL